MFTSPIGLKSLTQAVTMISNHDEVGNAARTIAVACGAADPTDPPQQARNLARFTMLIGMMSPGKPFFFQGDEFGATNNFKWGITSTWDMGWTWLTRVNSWDWSSLHFNDTQRALYERLYALGDKASDDPAYKSLSDADKKVFADIGAAPSSDRKQLYIDIERRQQFECTKAAIKLRKDAKLFADVDAKPFYSHNDNGILGFQARQ